MNAPITMREGWKGRWACWALIGSMVGGCALPPRVAWQRMREDGVLRAIFPSKRAPVAGDATERLAGADLSVEPRQGPAAASPTLPLASVAEMPGFVYSPHTVPPRLVNVQAFAAGDTALCPYTLEAFVVPATPLAGDPIPIMAAIPEGPEPASPPPVTASTELLTPTGHPAVQEVVARRPNQPDSEATLFPQSVSTAPFGNWVPEKPGHVYSPYAARHQLVNVVGLAPGSEVSCPFSGRIFRLPPTSPSDEVPEPTLATTAPSGTPAAPTAPASAAPTTTEVAATSPPIVTGSGVAPAAAAFAPATAKYGATHAAGEVAAASASPRDTAIPSPSPVTTPPPAPAPATAKWVRDKPGLVQSPYGKPGEWVDVTGRPSGTKVICPYTFRPFLVPPP